jgi:hypothetical protein
MQRQHLYLFVITAVMGPNLSQDSIYVCLHCLGNRTFHWSIVIALNETRVRLYHATDGSLVGGWIYEAADHEIVYSATACVVMSIGELSPIYLPIFLIYRIQAAVAIGT